MRVRRRRRHDRRREKPFHVRPFHGIAGYFEVGEEIRGLMGGVESANLRWQREN